MNCNKRNMAALNAKPPPNLSMRQFSLCARRRLRSRRGKKKSSRWRKRRQTEDNMTCGKLLQSFNKTEPVLVCARTRKLFASLASCWVLSLGNINTLVNNVFIDINCLFVSHRRVSRASISVCAEKESRREPAWGVGGKVPHRKEEENEESSAAYGFNEIYWIQ